SSKKMSDSRKTDVLTNIANTIDAISYPEFKQSNEKEAVESKNFFDKSEDYVKYMNRKKEEYDLAHGLVPGVSAQQVQTPTESKVKKLSDIKRPRPTRQSPGAG
ncbi:MAG: hypothetical protein HQL86_06965, partial [Magnetococcales bacterium]|nr:hypothetical protein [Magnetococcales bacterium]